MDHKTRVWMVCFGWSLAACQWFAGGDGFRIDEVGPVPDAGQSPAPVQDGGEADGGGIVPAVAGASSTGGAGAAGELEPPPPPPPMPDAGQAGASGAAVGVAGSSAGSNSVRPAEPGQACSSDAECGGTTCLRQGYCEVVCNDNSRCGSSPDGVDNLCLFDPIAPTDQVCFVGCRTNADCAAYPATVCQPVLFSDEPLLSCHVPGDIGYPCDSDSNCAAPLTCLGSGWCNSEGCAADRDCGQSVAGQQNRCLRNQNDGTTCFPGCKTNTDCAWFENTSCQRVSEGVFACARVSVGQACKSDADCGMYTCQSGWCGPETCDNDADCGLNPRGIENYCGESVAGKKRCFSGCEEHSDCSDYDNTRCLPTGDGAHNVCSGVLPGRVCSGRADCADEQVCVADRWCSPATCVDDDDCAPSPTQHENRCLINGSQVKVCFPGCASDADCARYTGTTCTASGACSL